MSEIHTLKLSSALLLTTLSVSAVLATRSVWGQSALLASDAQHQIVRRIQATTDIALTNAPELFRVWGVDALRATFFKDHLDLTPNDRDSLKSAQLSYLTASPFATAHGRLHAVFRGGVAEGVCVQRATVEDVLGSDYVSAKPPTVIREQFEGAEVRPDLVSHVVELSYQRGANRKTILTLTLNDGCLRRFQAFSYLD